MKKVYKIEVDCPNCALKVEESIKKLEGVLDASVNFMALKLTVDFAEGADEQKVMKAAQKAAKKVEEDTKSAMADANLPAGGIYSTGDTVASIVTDAKVDWHGSYGEISLGFDKSKPGAGGFLITGTPKMLPNRKLEDIYGRRKYESEIRKQIREDLDKAVKKYMGG